MSSRLFIGGISFDTTERDLREHFEQYGQITSYTIVYNKKTGISKGYGFLKVESEGVIQKILTVGKHCIKGRMVDVNLALDKDTVVPSHLLTKGFRRLFVGGLSHKISTNHLLDYFSLFGKVLNAFVITDPITKASKNFGYIEFEEVQDAKLALSYKPHFLMGHKLTVQNHKNGLKKSLVLGMKERKRKILHVIENSNQQGASQPLSTSLTSAQPGPNIPSAVRTPPPVPAPARASAIERQSSEPNHPPFLVSSFPTGTTSARQICSLNTQSSVDQRATYTRSKIFSRHIRRLGVVTSQSPAATDNPTYCFNMETQDSIMMRRLRYDRYIQRL